MRHTNSLFLLLVSAVAGYSQHRHDAAQSTKPAELLEGLGNHSHPIRTSSAEGQKFFDQGLALIFGFNHDEAARLFAQGRGVGP